MRAIVFSISVLMLLVIGSVCAVLFQQSSEEMIVGKWEEVSWELDKKGNETHTIDLMEANQKEEIYENLIIHQAEIWEFCPGRELRFLNHNNQVIENLKWNVKGRGHILELCHTSHAEDYHIQKIDNNTMVIYFSFDLQVRGVVKMTFKRIDPQQYVKKI